MERVVIWSQASSIGYILDPDVKDVRNISSGPLHGRSKISRRFYCEQKGVGVSSLQKMTSILPVDDYSLVQSLVELAVPCAGSTLAMANTVYCYGYKSNGNYDASVMTKGAGNSHYLAVRRRRLTARRDES